MTFRTIFSMLTVMAACLITFQLFAQAEPAMSKVEYDRLDSLFAGYKQDQIQTQKTDDAEAISDVKSARNETKAKAKDAERVSDEAQNAAKKSRNALKTEKKAQKLQKQADKQAEKAKVAIQKSDLN
ncbi:hypothetical protein WBG78_27715 [Chryseolinea sp. T2]|uniref:hypothetical protein n=1 Tax=Chryseolinea sp. T2 TaxID=3129255 RepID=UPI003077A552